MYQVVLFDFDTLSLSIVTEYACLQTRVKNALERRYKDFLKHDWLEDGLSFSLMENYTDLSWAKMVNKPMERKREPVMHMDDILQADRGGKKCQKILIEGVYLFYRFPNVNIVRIN